MNELKDIVRFLCCVENKGKGDSFSKHSGSRKKLKERIAEVEPLWTKYFELEAEPENEDGGRLEPIVENDDENIEIAAC